MNTTRTIARHAGFRCALSSRGANAMANRVARGGANANAIAFRPISTVHRALVRERGPGPSGTHRHHGGGSGVLARPGRNGRSVGSPRFPRAGTPCFSTAGGGGDLGSAQPPPHETETKTETNTEPAGYDPFDITKSFGDTSYYFPPPEETDPSALAARYEGMTNEELMDTSTIALEDENNNNNDTGTTVAWGDGLMHSPPVRDKNAGLPRGSLVGTVVSTKMQKTVNVAVDRYRLHPKYRKRIRYTRKFMAHDEDEVASDGDTVLIVPSQRISKKKHFVLREIVRAKGQL
ncbi:unnamed protein product [Pseudo-nitzschia multistriata]|uniref:Small ribosomal subunit protein uS17c n=1 Tax=Pseudo-nitzschia multistriata TaxID=183589 RepID=A0A448ZQ18_9STRA|nr:unnamed protein product [Pseudo-nitzschia multistriata]